MLRHPSTAWRSAVVAGAIGGAFLLAPTAAADPIGGILPIDPDDVPIRFPVSCDGLESCSLCAGLGASTVKIGVVWVEVGSDGPGFHVGKYDGSCPDYDWPSPGPSQ